MNKIKIHFYVFSDVLFLSLDLCLIGLFDSFVSVFFYGCRLSMKEQTTALFVLRMTRSDVRTSPFERL